jgi:3-methyladenine DNA glycosylase AlkD
MTLEQLQESLASLTNPEQALFLQRFFKTGPGQYGAGDLFRGIRVPALRRLAKEGQHLSLGHAEQLLHSSYHEDRLLALLILVGRFARTGDADRRVIYELYLANTRFINNWDLVDASAEHIVGAHLRGRDDEPLEHLASSGSLWERRIAIMATFHFIRRGSFASTLRIAELLIADKEDLIHKAVGWMLREVGKRDLQIEEDFLAAHYRIMPRTMLRYAIERFPEERRLGYLKGLI